jgi:hypothetical protein
MRVLVRGLIVVAALLAVGCGNAHKAAPKPAAATTPTPDAADVNREATGPELVHVYKTIGDDPYPWTLTVRADRTANLIVGGGHGGGDDKNVVLTQGLTDRIARLVDAVPWRRVAAHTVEPGGFGGNDNMARYMYRHRGVSTVYAAGDMPASVTRLTGLLDKIIDGDLGTITASDRHYSANGGILDQP